MRDQQLTARHLPEVRAELAFWLSDDGPGGGPETWSANLPPDRASQERLAAADWSLALRASQLFYASTDMTRLAVSAGLALPSYRLHPEDLPATHGLIVWEDPVTDSAEGGEYTAAPLTAASWAVRGGGVHVRTWCTREKWIAAQIPGDPRTGLRDLTHTEIRRLRTRYPQPIVNLFATYLPFGRVPGWLAASPKDTSGLSIAAIEDLNRAHDRSQQAERALIVTWLLMGQTLVRQERVEAPKSAVKHIRRLDPALLTSARYVQLRHRSVHAEERGSVEGAGGSYHHRWVVRGHWRNHWYPSRQAHRPIWIDDHWKGPEGAPILDPDKLVSVLRR